MRTRNKVETRHLAPGEAVWSSFPPGVSTLPPEHEGTDGRRAVSQAPDSKVQRSPGRANPVAEGLVQTLLDSSADGVFILDERLTLRAANETLSDLANVPREQLLEHHVLDVFPLMQQLGPDVFEFVLQGRTLGGSLDGVRPEQATGHSFDIKLTPVFEAGRVSGILGIVRDTTQQKLHAARLHHIQKLGLASRLATSSAHDLSNLLTVIHAEVSRALFLCEDPELVESLLEIQNCTEKSGVLTREVLSFARKNAEHPSVLRVGQLISDSRRMFERLLGSDVALNCEVRDEMLRVAAHRGQLEQVLVNLIANARDALVPGGRVDILVRQLSLPGPENLRFGDIPPGEYCCMEVKDTGHGMDAAVRQHLFESFFTTKPEGSGTGLGLATSRDIITASGGHLIVESEPRVGTQVFVVLPLLVESTRPTVRPSLGPGVHKAKLAPLEQVSPEGADLSGLYRVS